MTYESASPSLIPPQAVPEGAHIFAERVQELLDGRPKDEATVAQALEGMEAMFDHIAAGLYTLASMLVGEGEESVRLVENAIATADVSACGDPVACRKTCRRALSTAAIELLVRRSPGSLAAPQSAAPASTCIGDDDLDAADVRRAEFERMIAGPDRDRVRQWLRDLPTDVRTVFVLRAAAGFTAQETAALLAAHGGASAAGWTAASVSETFRQGLCSLASQLLQASVGQGSGI